MEIQQPAGYERDIARNALGDLIRRAAQRKPEAPALSFEDRTWTYGELYAVATAAAGALAERGVGPGDRIAFLGRNSDLYVIGWLATAIAGAVHVPINYMLGVREVAYILGHAEPTHAFADSSLFKVLEQAAGESQAEVMLGLLEAGPDADDPARLTLGDLWRASGPLPRGPDSDRAIAQLAYTSGTESSPKGVMLSHRALLAEYASCAIGGDYAETDTVLHALPLYHCAQMHCFLMPYLYLGARNVIIQSADPQTMLRAVADEGVTSIFAPPTVWIGMLRSEEFSPARLGTLSKGYYGASIMPINVLEELSERLPDVRLWNYYGQTEIAPLATVLLPDEQATHPGSAGRPALNVETRVVDDALRDVAPGAVGEIVHRSPQLLSGYYRAPELTDAAFEGGWFHSGDLATIDADGYITVVDRKKDMINSGGENVSSREVEEVLYGHADVAEVAVVGLPDEKWIEAVCAVVVSRRDGAQDADSIVAYARDQLAPFKVPKVVRFADELPKNPSGKILKRELRERLSVPEPAG